MARRNHSGNRSLMQSVERIIQQQANMDLGGGSQGTDSGAQEIRIVETPVHGDSMVSAELLEQLKAANFNCKTVLDNLDTVKAQICERQLSYQDVMNALQNGTLNGLGPSPTELRNYANVLVTQTREMNQKTESLRSEGISLLNQTYSLAKDACVSLINGDLYNWKVHQKKAQFGPRLQSEQLILELDKIEPHFEVLGAELRRLVHHIALMEKDFGHTGCQQYLDEIRRLRTISDCLNEDFIKQSVIITQQPPSYLMKTRQPTGGTNRASGRHPCTPALRVLGGQIMACGAIHPKSSVGEVKCILVSEEQAKSINAAGDTDYPDENKAGNLLHNTAVFEMPINSKVYSAEFKRPLQLIKIDRPEDEHETIPRQRYYLAFLVRLPFVTQPFWKLSLPVAALVHPRQARDQGADAYMFWEYAFSHGDGVLTYVPRENSEGVAWPELASALKMKFMQLVEGVKKDQAAQFTLTDDNLNHIGERFAKTFWGGEIADYTHCRVTWEMFFQLGLKDLHKENDDSPVPFWEWFYKNADIVQKHLLYQWNKGLVYGFCSRMRSEALLRERFKSTLMVKFSDTQFGSLIISYYSPQGTREPSHLKIKSDDLTKVAPENCVLDIPNLANMESIFPDIPIAEFRPEKKPEKTGRKSPTDKQKQPLTDPYFTTVSVGFRAEIPIQEWPVPQPPENWENLDFEDLIRNIEMSPAEDMMGNDPGYC